MHSLYKLEEMLLKEADDIAKEGELTSGSLGAVESITTSVKNIEKIAMMMEDKYSHRDSYRGDSYASEDSYDMGDSYARRGMHYVRGHYSRDGGDMYSNRGEYSERRGYSRGDGKEYMIKNLEEMKHEAKTPKEREAIEKCLNELKKA